MRKRKKRKVKVLNNPYAHNKYCYNNLDAPIMLGSFHITPCVMNWISEKRFDNLHFGVTPPVCRVFDNLTTRGVYFELEKPFYIEGKIYFADIWIPSINKIIEVDGRSHKGREDYDEERDERFLKYGIETIRINNVDTSSKRIVDYILNSIGV